MNTHSGIRIIVSVVLVSQLAFACSRQNPRLAMAYVIDMTGSVDREAIQQSFAALKPLLKNETLKRGDSITVIPITGDAMTEAQGKILRIHLPKNREAYDADLARLATEAEKNLQAMLAEAASNPYQHSDILGAADLAAEELSTEKGNVRKVIVILSDFIQDDARFNFNTSPDLARDRAAIALAKKLSAGKSTLSQPLSATQTFADTSIYLGLLRSKDLRNMPAARREAVQSFWKQYFKSCGTKTVALVIDGPGKIQTVLDSD